MGDKILKKLFLLPFVLNFTLLNGYDDISWVNAQIEAIKPKRKGVSNYEINMIKDPFIFLEQKDTKEEKKNKIITKKVKTHSPVIIRQASPAPTFKLYAIMNRTALINRKWYKEGAIIQGFKLVKVTYKEVILKRGKEVITLTTLSKKFHTNNREKQ